MKKKKLKESEDDTKISSNYKLSNNEQYVAGIGITAIGGAMIFIGALIAIYGGYQYKHINLNETTSLMFDVSPNRIGMQFAF